MIESNGVAIGDRKILNHLKRDTLVGTMKRRNPREEKGDNIRNKWRRT